MLNVIIDRKTWLRGEGSYDSSLLRRSDGKMCCLGFACVAAGIEPAVILEHFTVAGLSVATPIPDSLAGLVEPAGGGDGSSSSETEGQLDNSSVAGALMELNDCSSADPQQREACLSALGKDAGINFTFEN